jgi:hypothetical protein
MKRLILKKAGLKCIDKLRIIQVITPNENVRGAMGDGRLGATKANSLSTSGTRCDY